MLRNYYTLRALALEATPVLSGARIREIYSQQREELTILLEGDAPGLIISCRPETSVFYLQGALARARRNSADLFREAWGCRILECGLHPGDRLFRLGLENGRSISALLFGAAANVLLLEPDGVTITSAFRNDRELRTTAFHARQEEETVYDLELLASLPAAQPDLPAGPALRRLFPPLGATLAAEAFVRAGIDPAALCGTLTPGALEQLAEALQRILLEVQHPAPRIYTDGEGRPALFSILPLRQAAPLTERLFDFTHEAVRVFVSRARASGVLTRQKLALTSHLRQQLEKTGRTLEAVRTDAGNAARASEYERSGSALMAHLGTLAKGQEEVHLVVEEGPLRIALDRKLTPVQNAQRYFEKAKRARSAAAQSAGRIRELEERLAAGRDLLLRLEQAPSGEHLEQLVKEHRTDLALFGLGQQGEPEQFPFRRFVVDGGFEVWAGKSSQNNDELTLRHARPNDLWFHARGSSGSHVILRAGTGKGEPGKKAREQAAAIAAYYSKMKNAGLVPVAMTERRYVRKPKGSKPGTVTIEREKVLFVKPVLPPEGAPGGPAAG